MPIRAANGCVAVAVATGHGIGRILQYEVREIKKCNLATNSSSSSSSDIYNKLEKNSGRKNEHVGKAYRKKVENFFYKQKQIIGNHAAG